MFHVCPPCDRRSLEIAIFLQDLALEAQVCYSLGNVYTLLRDFLLAVHFHKRHLAIAEQLSDSVGEGRAYWSLGNAYRALGNRHMALDCASRHLLISKQVGWLCFVLLDRNTTVLNLVISPAEGGQIHLSKSILQGEYLAYLQLQS